MRGVGRRLVGREGVALRLHRLERGPQAFALRDGGLQPSTERRDLPLVRLAQRDRLPLGLCEARPRLLLVRARLGEAAPQPLALGEQVIRRGLQPLDLRLSLPALAFELTHGGLGAGERGPRAVGVSAGRGLRFLRSARGVERPTEVAFGRRRGALGRRAQLLLSSLLPCRRLVQLGRQSIAIALPFVHALVTVGGRGLRLDEARLELLELRRPRRRVGMPLVAQRGDLSLEVRDLDARLGLAHPRLLEALPEPGTLREERRALLAEALDLVARPSLLLLQRRDRGLRARERLARTRGLGVGRRPRLLGRLRRRQRPAHLVVVRRETLARGAQLLLDAPLARRRVLEQRRELLPLALRRGHALALALGGALGLRDARHEPLHLAGALDGVGRVHRGLPSSLLGALGGGGVQRGRQPRPFALRLGERRRLGMWLRAVARPACGGPARRGDGSRRLGRRDASAARRLDDARELAQRLVDRPDLLLGEPVRGERDEHHARDRQRGGVERDASDRGHGGSGLHERRHVAVPRCPLDQVDAPVEESVQRHVPTVHPAATDEAELLAALVREADLDGEPEQLVALIE